MDPTRSKLAAFFDTDEAAEDLLPPPTLDEARLAQYNAGILRKSKREKEKDRELAKAREEDALQRQAYAEFVETFDGPSKFTTNKFVRAGESAVEGASRPQEIRPPSPLQASAPKPKGKRAMDSFLEEMKELEREREAKFAGREGRSVTAMAAYDGQSGSKDRGDSDTSNIFVANLPPHVTEKSFGTFFAKAGAVGSVKIMWPRKDLPAEVPTPTRRPGNSGLSGFVSFMRRKDAEAALREFDGCEWGGCVLRVGWSKAVPVAHKPMYGVAPSHKRSHSRSRSPRRSRRSRSRSYDRSRSPHRRRGGHSSRYNVDSRSRSRSRTPPRAERKHTAEDEVVGDGFIRAVVAEIKGHGPKFELNLKEREKDNPKYAFMIHRDHRRHAFYRGLLERSDIANPEFDDEGNHSVYSTDEEETAEREETRRTVLGKRAKRRFEAMLRAVSGKRGEIARCMAFSLEHAEAAPEVAEIIIASLLVDGTAVPRKVARLHLICDILHNSAASVPSAWKFRGEFQSRLGIVFDHLSNIYHSFPGRITAETFKKQILTVVEVWEDWIVFPPQYTSELRTRLDGTSALERNAASSRDAMDCGNSQTVTREQETSTSKFKASSFRPATAPSVATASEQMDQGTGDLDGEGLDGEDLDGEAVDVDVDGDPMEEIDGDAI